MQKMLDAEGCKAFSNTFQDLYGINKDTTVESLETEIMICRGRSKAAPVLYCKGAICDSFVQGSVESGVDAPNGLIGAPFTIEFCSKGPSV